MLQINGICLHVEDHDHGKPVLLLHGWPLCAIGEPEAILADIRETFRTLR